jgi:hypothetical protein
MNGALTVQYFTVQDSVHDLVQIRFSAAIEKVSSVLLMQRHMNPSFVSLLPRQGLKA